MRRVSMTTRDELIAATVKRYAESKLVERSRILDQFVAVTGYHRKHAARLLRSGRTRGRFGRRPGRRIYDAAVREALIVLWEAADRICGKRLKPLLPVLVDAMELHGHLQLAPEVRAGVLGMSAATNIDLRQQIADRFAAEVHERTVGHPPRLRLRSSHGAGVTSLRLVRYV